MVFDKGLDLEVRQALEMNQRETAEFLGLSKRTIQRWDSGESTPSYSNWEKLATAVFPKSPELAARCARMAGKTMDELGLVQAPPPPAEPMVGPVAPELVVDALVCVAAEAVQVLPGAIRPALIAAFTRARQLGITVEMVERALVGKPATEKRARR